MKCSFVYNIYIYFPQEKYLTIFDIIFVRTYAQWHVKIQMQHLNHVSKTVARMKNIVFVMMGIQQSINTLTHHKFTASVS